MLREAFDWLKPAGLWQNGLSDARAPDFFQPQLLKLCDDNFISTFKTAAASPDPTALRNLVTGAPRDGLLKLFQPAHGCFYLVCAALCCRIPGFPDRAVQRADKETVFFVLRRFFEGREYGWAPSQGSGAGSDVGAGMPPAKTWQPLSARPRALLQDEDRLPLFPITGGDGRTILFGYVPVASREVYPITASELNAAATSADTDPTGQTKFPIDVRIEQLQAQFTTPIKNGALRPLAPRQALLVSVYMLLDLWDFLNNPPNELSDAALALRDGTPATFTGTKAAAKQQLMAFLASQQMGGGLTLADALGAVAKQQQQLEATTPDPSIADATQLGTVDPTKLGFDDTRYDLNNATIDPDGLDNAVRHALPDDASAVLLPRQSASPNETFAIRCVYQRPQCSPAQEVVSEATVQFQLATYCDTDAPARQIRIALPTDVSIRAMRKFNKGVNFMISGSMQQKINMVTGHERDILKSPTQVVGSEGAGLAWMCSFSIQIIFIVAFFLLIMFVIILNFVFWWIAFFKICLPIPKKLLTG